MIPYRMAKSLPPARRTRTPPARPTARRPPARPVPGRHPRAGDDTLQDSARKLLSAVCHSIN